MSSKVGGSRMFAVVVVVASRRAPRFSLATWMLFAQSTSWRDFAGITIYPCARRLKRFEWTRRQANVKRLGELVRHKVLQDLRPELQLDRPTEAQYSTDRSINQRKARQPPGQIQVEVKSQTGRIADLVALHHAYHKHACDDRNRLHLRVFILCKQQDLRIGWFGIAVAGLFKRRRRK